MSQETKAADQATLSEAAAVGTIDAWPNSRGCARARRAPSGPAARCAAAGRGNRRRPGGRSGPIRRPPAAPSRPWRWPSAGAPRVSTTRRGRAERRQIGGVFISRWRHGCRRRRGSAARDQQTEHEERGTHHQCFPNPPMTMVGTPSVWLFTENTSVPGCWPVRTGVTSTPALFSRALTLAMSDARHDRPYRWSACPTRPSSGRGRLRQRDRRSGRTAGASPTRDCCGRAADRGRAGRHRRRRRALAGRDDDVVEVGDRRCIVDRCGRGSGLQAALDQGDGHAVRLGARQVEVSPLVAGTPRRSSRRAAFSRSPVANVIDERGPLSVLNTIATLPVRTHPSCERRPATSQTSADPVTAI